MNTPQTQRMQNFRSYTLFVSTVLLFISAIAHGDEIDDGMAAFDNGDYATAYEILRPLAEHHGYAQAMNTLGHMFESGLGVEKQGSVAEKWYEKAALEGYTEAMYNLGILHAEGELVPKNVVTGLAWLGAAFDHRQKGAMQAAKLLSSTMSEEQLVASNKLRKEIEVRIYNNDTLPDRSKLTLTEPPLEQSLLLTTEQIVDLYSGNSSSFEFRESIALEQFSKHSSREKALSGKKAKFAGEYRSGFYTGKWWVKDNMLCIHYSRIDDFDDCYWLEPLGQERIRSHSAKTGGTNDEQVQTIQ